MAHHTDLQIESDSMTEAKLGSAGLKASSLKALTPQLTEVHHALRDLRRLGQLPFQDLPHHKEEVRLVAEEALRVRENYDTILLLGIGGSALGARFLLHTSADFYPKSPDLKILSSLDAEEWQVLAETLNFKKTALLVVSKSGQTLETLAAFLFFRDLFHQKLGEAEARKRFYVITDPHSGILRKIASEEKLKGFSVPSGVGGRFSILSAVGLFPAACLGVAVEELLAGALKMDERCQAEDVWQNPALLSAAQNFLLDRDKRIKTRVLMPYGERLSGFSPWFAQLWAESLGKKKDLKGKTVFAGTTPVVGRGPQDQHSQLQLYLDGPRDKSVTFVTFQKSSSTCRIPMDARGMMNGLPVSGKLVHDLMMIEKKATEMALTEAGCPNQTIQLWDLSPQSIGQLIYFSEMETVYAGCLYNVNPFDQPAVESIKKHTYDLLKS